MAILSFRCVSVSLTEDQLKGLLKRYDTNGDGRLSKKELKVAFRNLGLKHSGGRNARFNTRTPMEMGSSVRKR
ncbi:hypothetical protein Acr_00g0103270 [Actinidia rufa]|uniref:EF-hand domain-containing protein n=1 Tax=Actinidia rufa TaxID=165716 RepID=A0A7J0E1A1_9ERIC|nr:hypothetical protein Acr_00g0103270 [Actinidia rufa]